MVTRNRCERRSVVIMIWEARPARGLERAADRAGEPEGGTVTVPGPARLLLAIALGCVAGELSELLHRPRQVSKQHAQ